MTLRFLSRRFRCILNGKVLFYIPQASGCPLRLDVCFDEVVANLPDHSPDSSANQVLRPRLHRPKDSPVLNVLRRNAVDDLK